MDLGIVEGYKTVESIGNKEIALQHASPKRGEKMKNRYKSHLMAIMFFKSYLN
jgi:hypothetical protein